MFTVLELIPTSADTYRLNAVLTVESFVEGKYDGFSFINSERYTIPAEVNCETWDQVVEDGIGPLIVFTDSDCSITPDITAKKVNLGPDEGHVILYTANGGTERLATGALRAFIESNVTLTEVPYVPPTPEDKLKASGLTVNELKELLGLAT